MGYRNEAEGFKNTATTQAGIATTKAGEAAGYKDLAQTAANAYYLYNVTNGVPLGSGYYTLTTAISAVPVGVRKKGLQIIFEISAGNWMIYKFIGEVASWTTITNWITLIEYEENSLAETINNLEGRIYALEQFIKNSVFENLQIDTLTTVKGFNYNGAALILIGTTAPSVTPDFIGQFYINTTGGTTYQAKGVASSADWKQTA